MATASSKQRFTPRNPCPICGGDDHDPRGKGRRCFGFLSGDGEYAHCTRAEFAGEIKMKDSSQTYPHKLHGACKCGVTHNPAQYSHESAQTSHNGAQSSQKRRLLIAYNYMNAEGELLFQCVRWEPKGFSQRHPDGAGGWIWNLDGIQPVLYRLPELLAANPNETIWIVEGEKDVETLRSKGLVATCNPMGAGKWRSSYNTPLKGRQVVIIPDSDAPGKKHAEDVAWHLHGIAKSVKIVTLPEGRKDVSDYFCASSAFSSLQGSPEMLQQFARETPEWQSPHKSSGVTPEQDAQMQRLETMTLQEILDMDFPEPEWVIPNLIPQGQVTIFAGKPKVGKSWWVLSAALAVVEGAKAFGHGDPVEQGEVLYLALEDTDRRLKNRGVKLLKDHLKNHTMPMVHGRPAPSYLHLYTKRMPRLTQGADEMIDLWLQEHPGCKMVVIDTLAKVKPERAKNGDIYAEDYASVAELIEIAHRRNVGILVVTHCRKASGEDVFDEINASTGLMGAAEAVLVMRRRRGEDMATLHASGKDVDEQELAMQFFADSGRWVILGDAAEFAKSKEQEDIFAAIDALAQEGQPATTKAIKDLFPPEKSLSTIRGILWRMKTDGLIEFSPDDNSYHRKKSSFTSTGSTPSTGSTGSTGSTEEEILIHAEGRFGGVEGVEDIDPIEGVEGVDPNEGFFVPEQTETGLIAISSLIEPETLTHVVGLVEEEARAQVLHTAQEHDWKALFIDGWARGGGAFSWKRIVEGAKLSKLFDILTSMQQQGWQGAQG